MALSPRSSNRSSSVSTGCVAAGSAGGGASENFTADKPDSPSVDLYAVTFTEPFVNDIDIFTLEDNAAASELPDQLSGINRSEIIDYLMLENIEINDIYEIL